MVERSRAALGALRENGALLGAGSRARFVFGDALHFLDSPGETRFDVVFVDPPYGRGLADEALARLPGRLAGDAAVYVESDTRVAPVPPWRVRRHGRAGAVHYHLMEWGGHDHGSLSGDV